MSSGPSKVRVNAVVPGWMAGPSVDIYVEMTSTGRGVPPQVVVGRAERERAARPDPERRGRGRIDRLPRLGPFVRHDGSGARHQRGRDLRLTGRRPVRLPVPQGPSPPLAVHERGSQGCKRLDRGRRCLECARVPGVAAVARRCRSSSLSSSSRRRTRRSGRGGGGGGALTEKSVPVTTVTWEPAFTWVGSMAMMTAPERELATACAAASWAGVLDA